MSEYNWKERNFINGVWKKVCYMELVKKEQENIKRNKKRIRNKKIKLIMIFLLVNLAVDVPALLLYSIDMLSVILSGIVLICAGTAYEYMLDSEKYVEVSHEN